MEKLLKPEELTELLGIELSTLYSWTHRKRIPYVKAGKLVRFRESDVLAWIERQTVKPGAGDQPPNLARTEPKAKKAVRRPAQRDSHVDRIVERVKSDILNVQ